jgi:hypothetical protein
VVEASERLLCIGRIQMRLAERLRKSFVISPMPEAVAGRVPPSYPSAKGRLV